MRTLLLLLLAAGGLAAQEPTDEQLAGVRAALDRGDFDAALALAEAVLAERPGDDAVRYLRAQAIRGRARDLQRSEGYDAARAYLSLHLDHPVLADAYANVCLWSGREDEGVAALRASPLPLGERILPELRLLIYLRRYDAAARRARDAGLADWEAWCQRLSDDAARLRGYARRGRWTALVAGLAFAAAAWALFRLAPSRRPTASASPSPGTS